MMVPLWVARFADAFWEAAGSREPFPRTLRRFIARALPMVVISLPRLHLRAVLDWLGRHRIPCACSAIDRSLHACLHASRGWGYLFLDGADPEDEQRLSLAHELAHFLKHYWRPRRDLGQTLGEQGLEIIDGHRAPTDAECVRALLAQVALELPLHFMERDEDGATLPSTAATEDEADRLAYELLAPAEEVLRHASGIRTESGRIALQELLRGHFGLPAAHALRYAEVLLPRLVLDPVLRSLGLT
jgi:hypothetical protein